MQEQNPLPWGTQDKFQTHFIVKKQGVDPINYIAKTILTTSGHFATKKVTKITWNGGRLAKELNADSQLNEMIAQQSPKDATIFVDPTEKGIRIYGKWKNSFEFGITKELFEIYDKIAGHIKNN